MKIIFVVLFFALSAKALEYGCELQPSELNFWATKTAETFRNQKKPFPEFLTIQSQFQGTWVKSEDGPWKPSEDASEPTYATVEGFYRPLEDAYYSLIPIPIFGVALSRDKNVLYSCAHYDSDPQKTHLTIYMMRGSKLDPLSWTNVFGRMGLSNDLVVHPLSASLVGFNEI